MKLIEIVKKNHMDARKNKDTVLAANYAALISALNQNRVDVNDDVKVQSAIKKEIQAIKNANAKMQDMISTASESSVEKLINEIDKNERIAVIFDQLLPTYMTHEEVKASIEGVVEKGMNMGVAIKAAVNALADKDYEMRVVSEVVRELV